MSFLDSVLSSIETGKPSPVPPPKTPPPASARAALATAAAKPAVGTAKLVTRNPRPEQGTSTAGTKRKAEEPLRPVSRLTTQLSSQSNAPKHASSPTAGKPRIIPAANAATAQPSKSSANNGVPGPPKSSSPAVASKPPPKGSYADLMAQAKAVQQKAPAQVGMFKHQAVSKEKLSRMERKKRELDSRSKDKTAKITKPGVAVKGTSRDGSSVKKREPDVPSYKGTARPTPSPQVPTYRGTAGIPPRRDAGGASQRRQSSTKRSSRMNEYLGTDEEDEGDYADGYDDYYSDASSDMEAGLDDVEEEEAAALAAARLEDEKEWRAELAAKREKEERRKKLAALASKTKR